MVLAVKQTARLLKKGLSVRPRGDVENDGDPRGEFALFLRDWIDRKHGGSAKPLAKTLKAGVRTIQNWMQGIAGPSFGDLDRVAEAMGYSDWHALSDAVKRFHDR